MPSARRSHSINSMTRKYGASLLWDTYHRTRIAKDTTVELAGFKSAGVNFKLGLWNPETNGVRYLKALIYNLADRLDETGWERLRRIGSRETRQPIAVRTHGELVSMDYLQAVLELEFMFPKAAAKITDDLDELLAFYDRSSLRSPLCVTGPR